MKRRIFIIFSLLGIVTSIFLHISTYLKDYSQLSSTPYVVLFIGGLFLGLGWTLTMRHSVETTTIQKKYKISFIIVFYIIFAYGLFVSYKAGFFEDGIASIENGEKVIINHGIIIRKLTDREYILLQTWLLRQQSVGSLLWLFGLLGFVCCFKDGLNPDVE